MPSVTVTFFQATFFLASFVLFRNISAVADPIMNKLFGHNFGALMTIFFVPNFFDTIFFGHKMFLNKKIL